MIDVDRTLRLRTDFDRLLNALSETWPDAEIGYVRDEVRYGEYADALENLISLAITQNRPVTAELRSSIAGLIDDMAMRPDIERLMSYLEEAVPSKDAAPAP